MVEIILFFLHYAILLSFGVLLSFGFAGVRLNVKENIYQALLLFVVCGVLQVALFFGFEEALVWKLYPVITHFPIIAFLYLYYRKRLVTAVAAVATAYLCCQPSKWFGLLVYALTQNTVIQQVANILILVGVGVVSILYMVPYVSKLFNKDFQSICIFGSIPIFYYLFDYVTGIYTDLWNAHSRLIAEFLPFFICVFFLIFCVVYYREYEQKSDAERNEQLIRIAAEQQTARMEDVKRTEKELRIMRHDMRLFLNGLAVSVENGDLNNTAQMIASQISRIEAVKVERFCDSDMINYVLSDAAEKCRYKMIPITFDVLIGKLHVDEMLFCSILSNALDNAINAQEPIPSDRQGIKVMLKHMNGKVLFSVKNAVLKAPEFSDGLPVTSRKGHGYGTQSICYITEKLGGNYQFSMSGEYFLLRVIL